MKQKIFSIVVCSLLLICEIFSQGIPQTINYQGVLKDASGNIVTNGDYNLTFKLYETETGGSPLWTETKLLNVVNGIFSTQLGSVTPITLPFDNAYWLGVTIGGGTEMSPRIKLSSVPYSFMSQNVPDGSITAKKIANAEIVKSVNGLKDSIALVAGSNVTITPSGNNLTISAAGGGGGGTVTQVNTGAGLTGGPITTTGTISIANDGITTAMLQNNSVTTDKISDGTIATTDLSDNSVTSAKIVDGTIVTSDLANNSVTSDKIIDGTIKATDIGNTQIVKSINSLKDSINLVAGSNVTITPSGNNLTISAAGGGTVTQVNTGAGLTGGPITTTGTISIANEGITTAMLQNNSVTTDKIVDGTISTNDLANNSVTSTKIADGTISTTDLSDNSVTSAKIVDGTIVTSDLANNSVTTDKIVDGTITATDIANTQVVKSINSLKDNVNLVAGSNITITPSGQNLTISSTSGGMGGSGTTNYLPVFTGNTTLGNSVIYQSSDKIGIGMTNPSVPLHVYGTGQVGIQFNGNDPYYSSIYVNALSTNSIPGFGYLKNNVLKATTNVDNDGKFRIQTGTTLDNRLVIDVNGNVGIGTNTPEYPIHVSSNKLYSGYFTSNLSIGTPHVIHSEFKGTGSLNAISIYGYSKPTEGYGLGAYFEGGNSGVMAKGSSYGVRGDNTNGNYGFLSSADFGVYGFNADSNNYGYLGGKVVGVFGQNHKGNFGGLGFNNWGAYGYSTSDIGVYGVSSNGSAVVGFCGNGGRAIYGAVNGGGNYAGYFYGNVSVTGTLSKGGGSFKIDHPLDPQNKYLYHSFVESPDMKNIYDGTVTTDASGYATVTLPEWFEALNKDFRYQLTVIGDFAQAIIFKKIQNNQFTIRTDKPNVEVSWQVTGIRHDAFAEKNRIPVEEYKKGEDVGKYLYPEAYGLSETMGIDYKHRAEMEKREKEK